MKKCQGCQEPGDRTKALSTESILGCVGTSQLCGCNLSWGRGLQKWVRTLGKGNLPGAGVCAGHVLKRHTEIRKAGMIDVSSQRYLFKIRRFPPQAPRHSAGDTDHSCLEYRWLIWALPRSQNSSYWNTKPACPEIKCCSFRSLKDPTEQRGKIKTAEGLARVWVDGYLLSSEVFEAGGALVATLDQHGTCLLLCCSVRLKHFLFLLYFSVSRVHSVSLKPSWGLVMERNLPKGGSEFWILSFLAGREAGPLLFLLLGFLLPPLKRPKRWH